jgi:hypothetical protein
MELCVEQDLCVDSIGRVEVVQHPRALNEIRAQHIRDRPSQRLAFEKRTELRYLPRLVSAQHRDADPAARFGVQKAFGRQLFKR